MSNLTLDQQKLEIAACAASPAYFLSYTSILDTAHNRVIPFKLWPFQKDVLAALQMSPLLDILKARQLGISWTLGGFSLWEATFHEAATVLLLSKEESAAKDILSKIKIMWSSLPYWLRPEATVDNTTTLGFGRLNSEIQALPSTPTAGRSKTATLIICDEWAYHPFAEENFLAYKPTIDAGGRLVGSSTANGRGGFYYEMWKAAEEGSNGFHPLFLPWNLRPDRDEEWYEQKKKEYSATQQLRAKFLQEYPSCVSGDTLVSAFGIGISTIKDVVPNGDVTHLHGNGIKQVFRLTTRDGRTLTATPDHRIQLPDGSFKELGQLAVGDEIATSPPHFRTSEYTVSWQDLPACWTSVRVDEDIARFLGMFVGDGCYHNATISIACCNDEDVVAEASRLTAKITGITPHLRETGKKQGNAWELRVGAKKASKLLQELEVVQADGSRYFRKVCVPGCILQSPKNVVREFLRGIFETDGFIAYDTPRIVLFSKHEEFLRQIQVLLLGFGITSRISIADKLNGRGQHFVGRELRLRANETILFMKEIGFISRRKNDRINNHPVHPDTVWNRKPIVYTDVVMSIGERGYLPVFDLTVKPEHVYSANGIAVHNCSDDAFQAMEAAVFDKDVLDRLEADCRAPIEVKGDLKIWKKPDPVKTYMIGCDSSAGQGKDRSGSAVIDYLTGEHVADLHGQIEPDDLARQTCALGKDYNYALIGVERNNHGHTVLNVMYNYLGYPNLYRQTDVEDIGSKLGYLTTYDSKAQMVEEFKVALHRGDYLTHDVETIKELRTFCQYETQSKTGKPRIHYAAANGTFDDRVMKNMIGWQMRHYVVRTGFNQKAKYTVEGGV